MLGPAASFAVGMTRKNWLWQGKRMTDWTRRLQLIPLIASNAFCRARAFQNAFIKLPQLFSGRGLEMAAFVETQKSH
jgi:hypothetical protein